MKIPFRQTVAGNCGLYTLANLFNEPRYLEDAKPGSGQDTYELNQAFAKHVEPGHYLTMDWMLPLGCGRITDVTGLLHFTSEPCEGMPGRLLLLVVIVASRNGKMLHAIGVACEAKQNPRLWVADSCCEYVHEMSMPEFLEAYHVQGLMNFRKQVPDLPQGDSNVCVWDEEAFTHLTGLVYS
ncbi:hypothetical protein DNI29_19125 [Hymenobacter sediminis]|uniref:hypothetical protein n=1 Tax=Hymenobacter sediminis TaxID=2218621 RepID=UPI000DA6D2D0|nr:hypothetical protein [Hymenobacter sediminis]RPD45495.1 hypothetical protein DNI29_19125 [Hymenobacter sediminis]